MLLYGAGVEGRAWQVTASDGGHLLGSVEGDAAFDTLLREVFYSQTVGSCHMGIPVLCLSVTGKGRVAVLSPPCQRTPHADASGAMQ